MNKINPVLNGSYRKFFTSRTFVTILVIFAIAFVARFVLSYLQITSVASVGYNGYLETFTDFHVYYLSWLHALGSGLLPYRDFFYQYPPLFLYLLLPFYLSEGALGAAIPIILADSGSAILIYLMVKRVSGEAPAVSAGIAYALSPLALLCEGTLLLSGQPMLFFMLLAIYLLQRKRPLYSSLSLAIAVLFRQEAMFLAPLFIPYLLKYYKEDTAKAALVFIGVLLAVSLPFLLLAPLQYVNAMVYNAQKAILIIPLNSFETILSVLSLWSLLPVALLAIIVLYSSERLKLNAAGFYGAFIVSTLIAAFGYLTVHNVYRYYYLPVYALLLVASTNWKMPLIDLGIVTFSLLAPPGPAQELLPYLAILILLAVQKHQQHAAYLGPAHHQNRPNT